MRVIYCRPGGKVFEGCDVGVVEFFLLRPLHLVGLKQLVVGLAEVIAVFDELLDTAVVLLLHLRYDVLHAEDALCEFVGTSRHPVHHLMHGLQALVGMPHKA